MLLNKTNPHQGHGYSQLGAPSILSNWTIYDSILETLYQHQSHILPPHHQNRLASLACTCFCYSFCFFWWFRAFPSFLVLFAFCLIGPDWFSRELIWSIPAQKKPNSALGALFLTLHRHLLLSSQPSHQSQLQPPPWHSNCDTSRSNRGACAIRYVEFSILEALEHLWHLQKRSWTCSNLCWGGEPITDFGSAFAPPVPSYLLFPTWFFQDQMRKPVHANHQLSHLQPSHLSLYFCAQLFHPYLFRAFRDLRSQAAPSAHYLILENWFQLRKPSHQIVSRFNQSSGQLDGCLPVIWMPRPR